jgi:hypothetical protein
MDRLPHEGVIHLSKVGNEFCYKLANVTGIPVQEVMRGIGAIAAVAVDTAARLQDQEKLTAALFNLKGE